jgi:hypothetical protein
VEWKVDKNPTRVEWTFIARTPEITFVTVTTSSFIGDGDKIVEQAMGTAERFGLVLAGLKAYLEYGIMQNQVEDRFSDQLVDYTTLMK